LSKSSELQSNGPSTDRHNNPVIDPTENVLNLVQAAVERLDDLRNVQVKHMTDMAQLRDVHAREMREKEAQRIDAIRAVDVAASQQASKDAEVRASALAAQVAAAAEAQRNQVAAAAQAAATALTQALVPIQSSISELTQRMYEQKGGKDQVSESREKGASSGMWIGIAIAGVGLFISFIVGAAGLIVLLTHIGSA